MRTAARGVPARRREPGTEKKKKKRRRRRPKKRNPPSPPPCWQKSEKVPSGPACASETTSSIAHEHLEQETPGRMTFQRDRISDTVGDLADFVLQNLFFCPNVA
jgi:hypothetical protein